MMVADANLTLYLYVEGSHTDETQEVGVIPNGWCLRCGGASF